METRAKARDACEQLEQGYKDGIIQIKTILKQPVPASKDVHTVFFIQILTSIGEDPSKFLKLPKTKSFLIRKSVLINGKYWDWYLTECPTGPPCHFLDSL
jgi:hypothetical protein